MGVTKLRAGIPATTEPIEPTIIFRPDSMEFDLIADDFGQQQELEIIAETIRSAVSKLREGEAAT